MTKRRWITVKDPNLSQVGGDGQTTDAFIGVIYRHQHEVQT